MLYLAYLDEFGHIGPWVHKDAPKYNEHPNFGLGGFLMPVQEVRSFASWFYQLKRNLLAFEIQNAGAKAFEWEKKGAALFTAKNVERYPELRLATNRLLNQIRRRGGWVFFVGVSKEHPPTEHQSTNLYKAVLREAIKRLDHFCETDNSTFLLIVDEQEKDFRRKLLATAAAEMFGKPRSRLVEPPIQAESHLFQTLQCADWLCGLIGRLGCYRTAPLQYPELEFINRLFRTRVDQASTRSSIRPPDAA